MRRRPKAPLPKPVWDRRWLIIRLVLIWCAIAATWIIVWGPDDRVRDTAMVAIAGLAASVVCGYLGFATFDDKNYLQALRGRDGEPVTPVLSDEDKET